MSSVYSFALLPVIGEEFRKQIPVASKWNCLYIRSNGEDRVFCRSTWFGCTESKIAVMSLVLGPTMNPKSPSTALRAVAGDESVLVWQEKKEDESVDDGGEGFGLSQFGRGLPPWGNVIAPSESDSDTESSVETSTPPANMISLNESRVHFLEETDEEELSRRILMLSRSNKTRSAMELFRSMEFSGLHPNAHACNSLISCLVRCQQLDDALRLFEFMKTNGIASSHTYSLVLKAVADVKGFDSALSIFAELGGFARGGKNFDVIVYNTMLSVCGKAEKWDQAARIWGSMKENGHRGTEVTYSLLVSIFVRSGQNELAIDAYREMVHNGLSPRDDTMQTAIGACAKEGKWDMALNIFHDMLNYGRKPNLIACNALLNSLGKAGKVKLMFTVFETVKSIGHAPDSYTWKALLNGLCRANQYADALRLFESLNREQSFQLNEHLWNTALFSCQKLGLWDKALQLLWQFEASGLSVSTASYNLVISACDAARKPKVALEVYEHMVHQSCTPDSFTYLSLIRSCIRASLWVEVDEILDVASDVSLYSAVIHGMCLRGKVESAKQVYMKMCKSGLEPDDKTRALMLRNLQKDSSKRNRSYSHPRESIQLSPNE